MSFVSSLGKGEKEALAVTYAALILYDGGVDVTEERLQAVLKASGVDVPAYYSKLWAKGLKVRGVEDIISSAGSVAAPAPAAGAAAPAAAAPATEEKKKEKTESDEGGGGMGGLFGDDEDF
eukprot:TRINITY_DN380_c0_g2_i1.p1 TRINITY_DN380_c0_g2~~TRINITY_DN380_c0_g2_i1.p1  ORF type:complete len:121 (-),score=63.37 TRINITY_DN380_c0_g2_i1:41-403(-)